MKATFQRFFDRNALLIVAGSGLLSEILYLQFFARPAFVFRLYANPTNFGTMVGADKLAAFSQLGVFAVLSLLYLAAWRAASSLKNRDGWLLVFGWGILFCLPFFLMYPYGARDIFDYILRARVFAVYGQNPFIQTASAFPADPFLRYGWWTTFPSPYGPLWELTAGLGVKLAGDGVLANIFTFKLIAVIFFFATAGVIALALHRLTPERALSGTLLFLWNPVVLFETVGNAHNDMSMLLWVAASIWAAGARRWKLVVWLLAVGAVFKFIPVLLIPAAGLMGLANMPTDREKWKHFFITAAGCVVIWAAAYTPFWAGWKTLAFIGQGTMFTTSLPSLIFNSLGTVLGPYSRAIVGYAAIFLTIAFSLWAAIRLARNADWMTYASTSTLTLLFYVLVTCAWYQNWYLLWPLAAAVFLPANSLLVATVLLTIAGLAKPFIAMPIYSWLAKPSSVSGQEIRLTLASQGLPWLISAFFLIKSILRGHKGTG